MYTVVYTQRNAPLHKLPYFTPMWPEESFFLLLTFSGNSWKKVVPPTFRHRATPLKVHVLGHKTTSNFTLMLEIIMSLLRVNSLCLSLYAFGGYSSQVLAGPSKLFLCFSYDKTSWKFYESFRIFLMAFTHKSKNGTNELLVCAIV